MDRSFAYLIVIIGTLLFALPAGAQSASGKIVDEQMQPIPSAWVRSLRSGNQVRANVDGIFQITLTLPDTLMIGYPGFDTLLFTVKQIEFLQIQLKEQTTELVEMEAMAKRLAAFDVGYLPPIKGVQIYSGTNAVIELDQLSGAKSTANPREMFAKIPGLNIWENDGAGIQMGIGGRGLSPNRTANFNTRQNGYDISADALGYPESYYTPPMEALKSIEIIRGSAALQFGTQFGGLLNFILRDPPSSTMLEVTSRQTAGNFGYFGTFNRLAGTKNRFFYQVYHQYKRGKGFRVNSEYGQHQAFAQFGYHLTSKAKISLECTHMQYLAQQAGGLTDVQFEQDPQQSFRDRNWFQVKWNLLALQYDYEWSSNTLFNVRAFGMNSTRETLGFLGKVTQQDPGGAREMLFGQFKNGGTEARLLHKYHWPRQEKKSSTPSAFLLGARYYRGISTALQGLSTDGDSPIFQYQNPDDLEGSHFTYPSENVAVFADNLFAITPRLNANGGVRIEYISTSSSGYYKQYVIQPVNNDTLQIRRLTDSNSIQRVVPLFGGGLSYKWPNRTTLYTNFTQNYRAINFTDIRVTNPNIVIDSAIRDEYGYTAELGFRGLRGKTFLYDLAAFYVFYGDKIGLAPKPGTIQKIRTNIGDAVHWGIETFMELDVVALFNDSSKFRLALFTNIATINAYYVRSEEKAYENKQVEYVSPIIARSGLKFSSQKWSIQFQASYNSPQYADATNAIVPSGDAVIGLVPAYTVMDCSAHYAFSKKFRLEAGVNNLTNTRYFTRRATGYPGPGILPSDGRFFYLTAQVQLRTKK